MEKNYNVIRQAQMADHRKDFEEWKSKRNVQVFRTAKEIGIDSELKAGDVVDYCNGFGVLFENHTVLGFRKPENNILPNRVVYIDTDCYWTAQSMGNIIVKHQKTK